MSGMFCQASLCSPGPQLVSSRGGSHPQAGKSGCMSSSSSAWHQCSQSRARGASARVDCIAAELQAEVAQVSAPTSARACPPALTSKAAERGSAQAKEQEWQSRQALYASQAGMQTQQPGRTTPDLRAARAQRTLQMQMLTTELRLCASWQDLQALFLEHRSRMNHIHLSALMVRLAQLGGKASSSSSTANSSSGSSRISRARETARQQVPAGHKSQSMASARNGGNPQAASTQLSAFLAQLVPHIGMQLLTFGPRQLSNVMWALGRLGYTPGPAWITEWCGCAARKLDTFSPQDLAMSAWGLAASGSVRPPYPTGAPLLMVQMSRTCAQPDTLAKCKLQDVSNIVWALATVGVAPEAPTLQALVHRTHQLLLQGSKLQTLALARALANASAAHLDADLGNGNRGSKSSSSFGSSSSSSRASTSEDSREHDVSSSKKTEGMLEAGLSGGSEDGVSQCAAPSTHNLPSSNSLPSYSAPNPSAGAPAAARTTSPFNQGQAHAHARAQATSPSSLVPSSETHHSSRSHNKARAVASVGVQQGSCNAPIISTSPSQALGTLAANTKSRHHREQQEEHHLHQFKQQQQQQQKDGHLHHQFMQQQQQQQQQMQQQQQQQLQEDEAVIRAPVAMGLKPQELCNLAWGLAKLQYHPGERFLSLLFTCFTQGSRIAHSTTSSSSSSTTSAPSTSTNTSNSTSTSNSSSSSRRQHQGMLSDCPQHYANMLWSMAQLRYCPPSAEMAACLKGLLVPAVLSSSHSAAPASPLWSLGMEGLGTPSSTTTAATLKPPSTLGHGSSSSHSSIWMDNERNGSRSGQYVEIHSEVGGSSSSSELGISRELGSNSSSEVSCSNGGGGNSSSSSSSSNNSVNGKGSVPRSYRMSAADNPLLQLHPRLKGMDVAHVVWALGVLRYKPSPPLLRLILLHTHVALYGTAQAWGIVDDHGRNAATTAAASATASMEAKMLLFRGGAAAARVKDRTHDGSAAAALTAARQRQPLYAVLARMTQDRPQVGLSAIELVRTMWGLRQLFGSKPLPPMLADDMAGAALALVPGYHELDPPSLMYLARGLSGLGSTKCPPACGEALATAMDERLVNLNGHALAHIMASLARLHYRPSPALWNHACTRASQLLASSIGGNAAAPGSFGLTPSSRAAALGATAAATHMCTTSSHAQHTHRDEFRNLGKEEQAAVTHATAMQAELPAAAAAAKAPAGVPRGSRGSGTQLLPKRSRVLFASTMAGPRELALLLWGLAWTRGPDSGIKDADWANHAVHAARQAIPSLGTEELRQLVWAVVRLRLKPWPLMALRFERACLVRMRQLHQQGEPQPPVGSPCTRRPRLTMTLLQQRRIRHWLLVWRRQCAGRRHKGVQASCSMSAASEQMPASERRSARVQTQNNGV